MENKILSWLKAHGWSWVACRHSLRAFLSLLAVVFLVKWAGFDALQAALATVGLNVVKEVIVDLLIRRQRFDLDDFIEDVAIGVVGAAIGFCMTLGSLL